MEPKKYRLLKDLPGVKAGEIATESEMGHFIFNHTDDKPGYYRFDKNDMNYPDWFEPVKDEWPKVGDRVYAINIESFEPGEFIFDKSDAEIFKTQMCWNHFKSVAHRDGAIELIKKYRKDLGYE